MVSLDAFTVNTVTREIIFNENLIAGHFSNKAIRQTLGFREIGSPNATQPKFASKHVQNLYKRIDELATQELPVHDFEKLKSEWHRGVLLRKEIKELMDIFGKIIWGDPLNKRDPQLNPESQLLLAEKDSFYSTDLHIELAPHHSYISLQLEHLAYIKAFSYYRNHHRGQKSAANDLQPRPKRTINAPNGTSPTEARPSLIVKLKILSKDSRKLRSGLAKRKRDSRFENYAYASHERDTSDDSIEAGIWRKSARVDSCKSPPTANSESNDHNHENKDESIYSSMTPDLVMGSAEQDRIGRASTVDQSYSELLDSLFDDNGSVRENSVYSIEPDRGRSWSHGSNRQLDGAVAEHMNADSATSHDVQRANMNLKENRLMIDQAAIESTCDENRDRLRMLLLQEFSEATVSLSGDATVKEMWQNSSEANNLLQRIWYEESGRIQEDLGLERYGIASQMVKLWISRRDLARILGVVTGAHPLQDEEIPCYTYEQWEEMLGGEEEYLDIDRQLTQHRLYFRKLGATIEEISEYLASALASAIRHPGGSAFFLKNLVKVNQKLFSWKLDFSS